MMDLPVAINARFLFHATTGVERYASEVSSRLAGKARMIHPVRNGSGLRGHIWEQLTLPQRIENNMVLWSPANTGPLQVKNQVVTIHDISPIDHPEWFDRKFAAWYRYLLPRLARCSRRVITDSRFSRQRIIDTFGLPEWKVTCIPCGVNRQEFFPADNDEIAQVRDRYRLSSKYILSLGSLEPRKNLDRVLRAWELVNGERNHHELVLAGGTPGSFRRLNLGNTPEHMHMLGRVDRDDLRALYSGSSAIIALSVYEGFGLPLLEAMACGVPVIASNLTALPEVAGNAGVLVNPYDEFEIAGSISQVLNSSDLRDELIQRGFERVKHTTWERTAESVWEILQEPTPPGAPRSTREKILRSGTCDG